MGEPHDRADDQLRQARRVLRRIQEGPWPDLRRALADAEAFLADTEPKPVKQAEKRAR
jgi:hypothetical protein